MVERQDEGLPDGSGPLGGLPLLEQPLEDGERVVTDVRGVELAPAVPGQLLSRGLALVGG